MDNIDFGDLNYLAILVAVVFNQLLGALWYGTFAKPWMAETGMTQENIEGQAPASPRAQDRVRRRSRDRLQ